jgi:tetratricopeptide (TPR) repeat protein
MHTAAHRPILTRLALAAALLALPACGARPSLRADAPPAQVVELEPTVIEASVDGQGGLALDAFDAETLFTRAKDAFDSQRFDEAERLFGKLLERFPESDYAFVALYNRGLALEFLKQFGQAAAHFRRYAQLAKSLKDQRDGEFRWGYNLIQTGDFPTALDLYTRLLLETDLGPADRAEVYLRRGTALMRLSRYGEAEKDLRKALEKATEAYQGVVVGNDLVAESHFRRGEIYQRMCREVVLKLPVESMQDDLAEKTRYFRQSQASYIDALNVQQAYWATAAGLKLGELYEDFYTDILSAEVPRDFDKTTKAFYFVELRKKLVPLLEKSLWIYEKNATMSTRFGARNEWVAETEQRLERLRSLIEATHRENPDDALKNDATAASAGLPTDSRVDPEQQPPPAPGSSPDAPGAPMLAPEPTPAGDVAL